MRVGIVEDTASDARILTEYLARYAGETGKEIQIRQFDDVPFFLFEYKPEYDCVFLDIDLPGKSGLEAAKKIRERDALVPIIFVTRLLRYATRGYEVGAVDFLVKPYSYEDFHIAVEAAASAGANFGKTVTVRNMYGSVRIAVESIYYVEVCKHRVIYHTDSSLVDVWGSMTTAQKELPQDSFQKCGASYLVNLRHVLGVYGDYVAVGKDKIKKNREKKKGFLASLHVYISRGGGVK